MTKIGKRLAAVLLAVAMVVTFVPTFGTQTAYADGDVEAPVAHPETINVEVIGKSGNVATVGDTVRITMEITDETSVWDIMRFKKPISGHDGYETRKGRVEGTDIYWWEIDVDDAMENGIWKISRFMLEDSVGNEIWYYNSAISTPDETLTDRIYADFSPADFEVVGTHPDMEGPVIDMESIQVSPANASPGDTVTMSLSATDATGVGQINIFIKRPNGTNHTWQEMSLNSETGKYEYKWEITNETLNGKWIVFSIRGYDTSGNMTDIGEEGDELACFYVNGGTAEMDPPVIDFDSLVLTFPPGQTSASPGQEVSLKVRAADATGIRYIGFCYLLPQTGTTKLVTANYITETGIWEGDIDLSDTAQTGTWKLLYIEAEDILGNYAKVFNSNVSEEMPSMDLSKADFAVKRNIGKAAITGLPVSVTYSGKPFTPEPVLVDSTDGVDKTLIKDLDYTVNYYQNVNAGEAYVEIMGKGDYSGSAVETFVITPKTITPAVTLSPSAYTWNGKVRNPAVTVKDGSTAITASNYTVTYDAGCKNVGKYNVKVVMKGNYSGANMVSFEITQAANPLKISPKTATVKYSKLKKKTQTLAVTKVIKFTKKLNDKKTYTLVSAKKGSKSFKKYFKINKATGKVTIKKNSKMKKGTYKVKVKVKALGNTNYKASGTKTVTFKVKVK